MELTVTNRVKTTAALSTSIIQNVSSVYPKIEQKSFMTTSVAKIHNIPNSSTTAFRSLINGAQLANYAERRNEHVDITRSTVTASPDR